jgi:hypothetical protein
VPLAGDYTLRVDAIMDVSPSEVAYANIGQGIPGDDFGAASHGAIQVGSGFPSGTFSNSSERTLVVGSADLYHRVSGASYSIYATSSFTIAPIRVG